MPTILLLDASSAQSQRLSGESDTTIQVGGTGWVLLLSRCLTNRCGWLVLLVGIVGCCSTGHLASLATTGATETR
jgi:hypothetical protein